MVDKEIKINTMPQTGSGAGSQPPVQPPAQPPVQPQSPAADSEPQISFFKQNKWPIVIIAASLAVLVAGAFFVLRKPAPQSAQPKIQLTIDAPQQIPSGSEIVYKVTVANNDSAAIKNISMDLIYPQGFEFTDSTPKPTKLNGTQYGLPTIEPSQSATIMIKGNIQGNADETKTISALMHYQFANLNSNFIAQAQAQTQIQTANIALQFDGAAQANNNQDLTYSLSYSNYTNNPVSGFKITMTLPDSFKVKTAQPQGSNNIWDLGVLNPNDSGKITLTGYFDGASVGSQQLFTAKAEGSTAGQPSFTLSAAQLPVTIAAQALQADIKYDGSGDSVKPGEPLPYKVHYQNNSNSSATGVNIIVELDGPYDFDNLTLDNGIVNNNTITWDASQIPALKNLAVGAQGDFQFSLSSKNPPTRSGQKNLTLSAKPSIQSNEYQQAFPGTVSALKLQTAASLTAGIGYSSGSNPPTVGQSTTYSIELDLRNTTNDVGDALATMNLPYNYNFDLSSVNSDERGNVEYDRGTKQLKWKVGILAANSGSFTKVRKLQFKVTVIPPASFRNRGVPLVTNINFSGTDTFTKQAINLTSPDLSSINDPSQQGTVQ